MADIQRSIDLGRVNQKLATQLGEKDQRIAMLEVALEDAVQQASEYQQKVSALEEENKELREAPVPGDQIKAEEVPKKR